MNELYVKIDYEIYTGQLLLSRYSEIGDRLIFLKSITGSRIVYSININGGELLLGLDESRRINSLELNRSRKDWKVVNRDSFGVCPMKRGNVEFSKINSQHNELDLPLVVRTDRNFSSVKIDVGTEKGKNPTWIAISKQCFLKIYDYHLVGFWICF